MIVIRLLNYFCGYSFIHLLWVIGIRGPSNVWRKNIWKNPDKANARENLSCYNYILLYICFIVMNVWTKLVRPVTRRHLLLGRAVRYRPPVLSSNTKKACSICGIITCSVSVVSCRGYFRSGELLEPNNWRDISSCFKSLDQILTITNLGGYSTMFKCSLFCLKSIQGIISLSRCV